MAFQCEEFSVHPPLPKGLQLDRLTGMIHGEAKECFKETTFVLRGSHRIFDADSKGFFVESNPFILTCSAPAPPRDLHFCRAKQKLPPSYWKPLTTYVFDTPLGSFVDTQRPKLTWEISNNRYRNCLLHENFVDDNEYYINHLLSQGQEAEEVVPNKSSWAKRTGRDEYGGATSTAAAPTVGGLVGVLPPPDDGGGSGGPTDQTLRYQEWVQSGAKASAFGGSSSRGASFSPLSIAEHPPTQQQVEIIALTLADVPPAQHQQQFFELLFRRHRRLEH